MCIRPYLPADVTACLSIFDSNVPTYFALGERPDFEQFLREKAARNAFQVIEIEGRVVACGGLCHGCDDSVSFCWGMVERSRHGQGLGQALAMARLHQARLDPSVQRVTLSTSQHTQGFYARLGFQITRVSTDGHGPGLDAVEMKIDLQ